MSNSIAPGSSDDVNVKVTALTTNPNVPVTYKTIILKKNLVNGVNTLTQEMMSDKNIKYVIKYDYVLGENIAVPSNCILEFDGGSINGEHTIIGNNTLIKADDVKIFSNTLLFDGLFNNKSISVKNFGAIGDGVNDDTNAFKAALRYLNSCYDSYSSTGVIPNKTMHGSYLFIPNGVYKLTDTLAIKSQTIVKGESIEGVVLESYANIGITLEGTLFNGSPYIQNVTLENFFLIMNGGKIGIKNDTTAALGDCNFKNFTIQSAEVGIIFKSLWNCRFENVCVESVNFGVILTNSNNGGCNNNIIDNLKIASANKCGLYLSSSNGTYCTNLNIENIGNTWAGNYSWCGDYVDMSSTIDSVTYNVENPCAVYVEGLAYSNVFNCSWFEAVHATGILAICYLIKNAETHPGIHRMSITITDGYFNNNIDLPIKIATSAAVYLSRLNYWGNFDNGSIVIDYANNAFIDISFVHRYWITNIVSNAEKASKWVNIHHILDDYQNIVNNYTLQKVQGYYLERNKYDNGDNPYTVYYGKRIDASRKLIINYANSDINAIDYGTNREVNLSNGGTYAYKTKDNGVITLPGTFTYGANYVIKLTALDAIGATAIAGGYYISDNDFQSLKISFITPPSSDCNFNYYVDLPLTL